MAHVRFQLKQVNGKSQIYFGDDVKFLRNAAENKEKKKFSYKGRDQKFPIRGNDAVTPPAPPSKEQQRLPVRSGASKATRGPPPKKTATGGADTVTLTQDQLQLILSSVGKTAASDRDNSVRISVERTEGGLNIETTASPRRHHSGEKRRGGRRRDEDEDSAFGDASLPSEEEERPAAGARPRHAGGGENIFGLLGGVGGGGGGGGGSKQGPPKAKPKPKPSKGASMTGGVTMDTDEKMRRIIAENKGKMKEADLVDLLAAVYMEERKKHLDLDFEAEGNIRKQPKGRGRSRKDEEEEEERKPVSRKPASRRYDDRDDEEPERRARGKPRGARRHDEDDDDDDASLERRRKRFSGDDLEDDGNRRRRAGRQRRYDSEEEEEADSRQRGHNKHRARQASDDEEEEKEGEKKAAKAEPPKFLTAVEKKRLQWEKEKEENAKIKEYDPWNRPGAGAPPKDYFSETSAAMKKKEEDQQRYARELDAQRREKVERDAARRDTGAHHASDEAGVGSIGAGAALNHSGTFARGRGVANLDEKSSADTEDRRKRQAEHQEAIKRQVEEQQAKRAQERQRRIDEELREEAKLQRERDNLQRQYEEEQNRVRRREVEQESRLAQLQAANEAAEAAARFDKAQRRLQHLETSGHDTTGLRASLEAQLTARSQTGYHPSTSGQHPVVHVRHAAVPGLEGIAEVSDPGSGRWATPREVRVFGPPKVETREDLQTQTDASLLQPIIQQAVAMAISSSAQARELPVRYQAPRSEAAPSHRPPARKIAEPSDRDRQAQRFERGFVVTQRDKASVRSRAPLPVQQRPKWGAANPQGRRTLPQSEREVGAGKRQGREQRRARRQAELLAEMEANQHRVPGAAMRKQRQESPANWPGPEENGLPLGTYNLERDEVQPRTGRLTPPLPSRRRMGGGFGGPLATSRSEENLAALSRPTAALPPDGDLGIVRTSEILNPAAAARPLPVSRENTERQIARKTYLKGLNPAHFGEQMSNLDDRMEDRRHHAKNPIFNPGIVKDIPTPRQDAILQHLSDIRKNLLLKQREIETSLSLGAEV